jgi:hypothetical protein
MQTHSSPADPKYGTLGVTELEDRIRARAYEIYVDRGREDGRALDDWLQAKAEVLHAIAKPKAA